MPLGDRQENDLVHITLDVWQDKVYYLGKEYPATQRSTVYRTGNFFPVLKM